MPVLELAPRERSDSWREMLDGWWRERCLETGSAPDVPTVVKRRQKWIRMAVASLAVVSVASLMVLMRS